MVNVIPFVCGHMTLSNNSKITRYVTVVEWQKIARFKIQWLVRNISSKIAELVSLLMELRISANFKSVVICYACN